MNSKEKGEEGDLSREATISKKYTKAERRWGGGDYLRGLLIEGRPLFEENTA